MTLRQRIFRYYAEHLPHRQPQMRNYAQITNVLLLFESDPTEKNTAIKQLIKQLQADGKNVNAWGYVADKEATTATVPNFRILGKKEINIFHKPKIAQLQELQDFRYDLLIDLSLRPLLPLQYLALYTQADFKAGVQPMTEAVADHIHDLLLHYPVSGEPTEQQAQHAFEQIIHYLKAINA